MTDGFARNKRTLPFLALASVRSSTMFQSRTIIGALVTRPEMPRAIGSFALCAIFSVIIIMGLFSLLKYETTPGTTGTIPSAWPDDSSVSLDAERPTLVLFAHPRCPCTRSVMGELALIMAHSEAKVVTHVLFFTPDNAPDDWERTDLWRAAARIPGVAVRSDPDGREARRFGAATSGHTALYSCNGRLMFHGGITGSRGHAGSNVGRLAIESLLHGGVADCAESYVFGCSLLDRPDQP